MSDYLVKQTQVVNTEELDVDDLDTIEENELNLTEE